MGGSGNWSDHNAHWATDSTVHHQGALVSNSVVSEANTLTIKTTQTDNSSKDLAMSNDFKVTALPASCYNGKQYIRLLINGSGTYSVANNGAGILSATTVNGGGWVLLYGLLDNAVWNVTVTKNGAPSPNTQTLGGTLTTCANAPSIGCTAPEKITDTNVITNFIFGVPIGTQKVSGNYVVWVGDDGTDDEIYLYDILLDSTINISNNLGNESSPQISGDYIFWRSSGINATYNHALYHIPTGTLQVNFIINFSETPLLNGDYLVYYANAGSSSEIFYYRISTNTEVRVTNDAVEDIEPVTDGRFVVWSRFVGGSYNLFYYDLLNGGPIVQMTNDATFGGSLSVTSGHAIWRTTAGDIREFNVNTNGPVKTLTAAGQQGFNPSTDGQYAVWSFGAMVYRYNLTTNVRELIFTQFNGTSLSILEGKILGDAFSSNNNIEVFCYDNPSGTIAFVGTSQVDFSPQISGSHVFWNVGTSPSAIYKYDLSYLPPTPSLDMNVSDTARCTPFKLVLANRPVNHEVVWFTDFFMSNQLYADSVNNFQPQPTTTTTYYGGYRSVITGCVSKLVPVTLRGTSPLAISCPNDNSYPLPSTQCTAIVNNIGPFNVVSGCPPSAITYQITGATTLNGTVNASGNSFNLGMNTVTYTVTDQSQNSASCSFTVNIVDYTYPQVNCASNITVNAVANTCVYPVPNATLDATGSDNCTVTILSNYNNSATLQGYPMSIGQNEITWTATDISGNSSTCTHTITVVDNQPPIVESCPQSFSIPADLDLCASTSFSWNYPQFNDNCNNFTVNNLVSTDDRTNGTLLFDVQDRKVTVGETLVVTLTADQVVKGYQYTLNLNGLKVESIEGSAMTTENFAVFGDAVTTSWDAPTVFNGKASYTVTFTATKSGKLSEMLSVSSRITRALAFDGTSKLNVALRFNNGSNSTIAGQAFELYQNTPNPWVNKTQIGFYLPEATQATLKVYDATGRVLYTAQGDFGKGYNAFVLDRRMLSGVETGSLFYKVETATDSGVKQMIQIK